MGDLRAAYNDLVAAAREGIDMPKKDAAIANSQLLVSAGDLALDKLKEPDAAQALFREAAKLAPTNWSAALGEARVAEQRGDKAKAAAIYRRILAGTTRTPLLLERILASYQLKQLTNPLLRDGSDSVPERPRCGRHREPGVAGWPQALRLRDRYRRVP